MPHFFQKGTIQQTLKRLRNKFWGSECESHKSPRAAASVQSGAHSAAHAQREGTQIRGLRARPASVGHERTHDPWEGGAAHRPRPLWCRGAKPLPEAVCCPAAVWGAGKLNPCFTRLGALGWGCALRGPAPKHGRCGADALTRRGPGLPSGHSGDFRWAPALLPAGVSPESPPLLGPTKSRPPPSAPFLGEQRPRPPSRTVCLFGNERLLL